MEAINDLSDISDSESFEESKYEHQSNKKHKRKHSKTKRTREEKKINISDDSDLDSQIKEKFTECNPALYQEEYYSKALSDKRSSRHKSRKHHKRDRDLTARDLSASSISSNDSNENHYRKKNNNTHHRRRHKDSDKDDVRKRHRDSEHFRDEDEENSQQRISHSEEEVEGVDSRSGGSRSKRHKSRHKHSSRRHHRHRTSAERHARRLVRKRRRRSRGLGSSGTSAAEEQLRSRQIFTGEQSAAGGSSPENITAAVSAVIRKPDASQWDETTPSATRPNPQEETAASCVKSEPPSGSESDERPLRPMASAAAGGNRNHNDRREREGPGPLRQNRENSGPAANRSGGHQNGREVWGVAEPVKEEPEPEEKVKPNLGLSGKLTEDANTYKGVVIKYSQPSEARKPKRRWRWYIFKGEEELPFLPLHRQSAYLIGRERRVVDVPTDHPSCSKQHAVLQYRLVRYTRDDGTVGRTVKPYIIDLESANGTYVNNRRITSRSYVELLEKDVVKFGYSSREYVLLHETSKDSDADTADAGLDMSPVSALMNSAMARQ